jgi:predicted methyltransferase
MSGSDEAANDIYGGNNMKKVLLLVATMTVTGLALNLPVSAADSDRLAAILAAQPDEAKARYKFRHPQETLEFFGIEPGMTVVDVLPGGGWYTKILLPYLGRDGMVIGADYPVDVWLGIGYDSAEFIGKRQTWVRDWTARAKSWGNGDTADVSAFILGELPDSMHGSADVVMFVRALHNLAYTTPDARHLAAALQDAYDILKPGGIVGVVQHHARDDMPDKWADGEMGYLKKDLVIERMTTAGFELVGETDINANSKDVPTPEQYVWRLPPAYDGADTPEARAQVDAIGESNRMTLKFRKR